MQKNNVDAEIEQAFKLIDSQSEEIAALTSAIRLLHRRNEDNIRESTNVLAAVLATYNGRIRLDGNIIDAVINSRKKLEVRMSEPAEDGSRTLILIEEDEPSEDKEDEPTDEQLEEIEMSPHIFIEDDYEDGDDDENLVPA